MGLIKLNFIYISFFFFFFDEHLHLVLGHRSLVMQYFGPGFYKKGPFEQENKTKVHILFICSIFFWGEGGVFGTYI